MLVTNSTLESINQMEPKSTRLNDSRLMVTPRVSRKITGLGLPATYDLIESGVIPAIPIGKRRWLIPVAALEQALADNALALAAARRAQKRP